MVTGLVVARGAKKRQHKDRTAGAQGGAGVHVDAIAEAAASAKVAVGSDTTGGSVVPRIKASLHSRIENGDIHRRSHLQCRWKSATTTELDEVLVENNLDLSKDCLTFEGSSGEVFVMVNDASRP